MSQFLCFFDTIILCQVHHTTDHLLTRLLFPYVECPYLWIWSMTFFGGKRTSSESKKVFCCCHYRYQFSNLSADADIGDCPPKYTGISLWGRKRVLHSSEIGGLSLMKWPSETFHQAKTPFKMKVNSTHKIIKKLTNVGSLYTLILKGWLDRMKSLMADQEFPIEYQYVQRSQS